MYYVIHAHAYLRYDMKRRDATGVYIIAIVIDHISCEIKKNGFLRDNNFFTIL